MRRDVHLLILSRALRSVAFGYLSFVVPLYLRAMGFPATLIGLYFFVATVSSAFLVLLSGFLSNMIGRRNSLITMSSLFVITMVIFGTTRDKAPPLHNLSLRNIHRGGWRWCWGWPRGSPTDLLTSLQHRTQ